MIRNRLLTTLVTAALASVLLGGCAKQSGGTVATVDLTRIAQNWPLFLNYNNQINSDEAVIERSNLPERQKEQQREQLRARFAQMQGEVASKVQDAVKQLAGERGYQFVVTREYVGYGGVDITPDVERILKITETTPKP